MTYLLHIGVMLCIYVSLALSLNMVVGYGGLLSLCHAGFYGIGAYATALLMMKAGWSFVPSLIGAVAIASVAALAVGVPSIRLRGDYFVLATLSFQTIIFSTLYNWTDLTNGPNGISGIPTITWLVPEIGLHQAFFLMTLLFCVLTSVFVWRLMKSPFGRLLRASREDEVAASALGKNVTVIRLTVFVFAAALAAIPGGLYAAYARYVDPTSFSVMESVFLVSIVVIGGAGNLKGPVVGGALLVLLPEVLRFVQVPDGVAANLRQVIYGLTLVVLMCVRPKGIVGVYDFH